MVKVINLIFIFAFLAGCGKKGEIIIKNTNNPARIDQERVYKF